MTEAFSSEDLAAAQARAREQQRVDREGEYADFERPPDRPPPLPPISDEPHRAEVQEALSRLLGGAP